MRARVRGCRAGGEPAVEAAASSKGGRDYLKRIEALCGVPIDMISTGPDRDETIVCRHPFDA